MTGNGKYTPLAKKKTKKKTTKKQQTNRGFNHLDDMGLEVMRFTQLTRHDTNSCINTICILCAYIL